MNQKTVLVVAAHPDDEVLGCGGTIARLAAEGSTVFVAILGEGITSRYSDRSDADPSFVEDLRATSARINEDLGVSETFFFGLPDNRFDTVPLLDVAKIVEGLIDKLNPETVFCHQAGDVNVDHLVLHRAVITATRVIADAPVREVLAYEVPSSTEWAFSQFGSFRASVFFDISSTLQAKIDAMEAYEGEARPFPHPRSGRAIEALARQRGAAAGMEAAEAFELVRALR